MKWSIIILLVLFSPLVMADDIGDSGGSAGGASSSNRSASGSYHNSGSELAHARKSIERKRYKAAIQSLNLVVQRDHRNADALNLLGYSHRKLGNLKRSGKYYKRALKINPEHKGALEYQGELFVMLNELDLAKENQRKLKELCPNGCEQLDDLSEAIVNSEG